LINDLAAGRNGQLRGGVGKPQQLGTGDFIEPAVMSGLGEGRGGQVSDVFGVDERLAYVAGRQHDHAVSDRVQEEAF
jgi:hypothetical protein